MNTDYYCEKCNYKCNTLYSYKQHLGTTIHQTGKRKERSDKTNYKCEKCNYENNNKINYLNHILNNHSTSEERKTKFKFYCEYCDFGVFVNSIMEKHLNTTKHKLRII
jgi:hypothetical protein